MIADDKYLVASYAYMGFGPMRLRLLIDYFKSARGVWQADVKQLSDVGLSAALINGFQKHKQSFNFENYFTRINKLGIKIINYKDCDYPENLRELDDAPLLLYIIGKLAKRDVNSVAVVGSRKMTSYGKEVTERFASELASVGVTIVSGLAFGVDAVAHTACLEAGGRAIAVLASGLDLITPVSNRWLAEDIVKKDGALVSEYPLGTIPLKNNFPYRNRIISGLSKAVVVIEGRIKSGTILTANHAASQGRSVFAVPGQITSPMSQASHFLIQNGAKIAFSTKDILDELDMQLKVDSDKVGEILPVDEVEKILLGVLENDSLHLDEIARITAMDISTVSSKIAMMEMKGKVKNLGGGVFKKY